MDIAEDYGEMIIEKLKELSMLIKNLKEENKELREFRRKVGKTSH